MHLVTSAPALDWSRMAALVKKKQPKNGWEAVEFRVFRAPAAKFKVNGVLTRIVKGDHFILVEDEEDVYVILPTSKKLGDFSLAAYNKLVENSVKKRMTLKDALKTGIEPAKPAPKQVKPSPVEKRSPAQPKVTKHLILQALDSKHLDLFEDKKNGYCYFVYDWPAKNFYETKSVMVPRITDMTLDQWVEEGKAFLRDCKTQIKNAGNKAKQQPKRGLVNPAEAPAPPIIPYNVEKKLLDGKEITEQEYLAVSQLGKREHTNRTYKGSVAILMGPTYNAHNKQRMGMFGTDGTCLVSRDNSGSLVEADSNEKRLPYKEWIQLWRQWRNKVDGIQTNRYDHRQDSAKRALELNMSITWEGAVEAEIQFTNGNFYKVVEKVDKKANAIGIRGSGTKLRWIPMRLVKQIRPLNTFNPTTNKWTK